MAWRCSADSNDTLVANLIGAGLITSPAVERAMVATDRANYVPPLKQSARRCSTYDYGPYADAPQAIGHKATISAPHSHAAALEALQQRLAVPGCRVLDVGAGSGVLMACMHRMLSSAEAGGLVCGIECVAALVQQATAALERDGLRPNCEPEHAAVPRLVLLQGDGWEGAAAHGPFDAIHVGAAAPDVPAALTAQLRPGGRLLVPVGDRVHQELVQVDMAADGSGSLTEARLGKVRFVPLVRGSDEAAPGQRRKLVFAKPEGALLSPPPSESAETAAAAAPGPAAAPPPLDYDTRYGKGWAYGKLRNDFLAEVCEGATALWPPPAAGSRGLELLSLGEGQGRNAAYLAGLGHACTAVDRSQVGLAKARALAAERGVAQLVRTVAADLCSFDPADSGGRGEVMRPSGTAGWDGVLSIFCALPPAQRARLHRACAAALRPGGAVVIESFAPRHATAHVAAHPEHQWRIGPSDPALLVSCAELEADFAGFEIVISREVERRLDEGRFHRGAAVVTQFMARKPCGDQPRALREDSFGLAVAEVFDSAVEENGSAELEPLSVASAAVDLARLGSAGGGERLSKRPGEGLGEGVDRMLSVAATSLRISCGAARRGGVCRHCWVRGPECLCAQNDTELGEASRRRTAASTRAFRLRWVLVTHPNEFLRSTSTAKLAVQLMGSGHTAARDDGDVSELLVYGARCHSARLAAALSDPNVRILFPAERPDEERCSGGGGGGGGGATCQTVPELVAELSAKAEPPQAAPDLEPRAGAEPSACESQLRPTLTLVVPDGSWEAARAIVHAMQRLAPPASSERRPLRHVGLDERRIARHTSPLIEALRAGAGLGRISTLEACALFLDEAAAAGRTAEAAEGSALDDAARVLRPLVRHIDRLSALPAPRDPDPPPCPSSAADGVLQAWVRTLQAAARRCAASGVESHALGLRRCPVCGIALATPLNMTAHVVGRRHCEAVARAQPPPASTEDEAALANLADAAFEAQSCQPLRGAPVEPPDVALAALHRAWRAAEADRS